MFDKEQAKSLFKGIRKAQGVLKAIVFLLFLALLAVIAGYKLSGKFRTPVANDVQLGASPAVSVSPSPTANPSPSPKAVTVVSPTPVIKRVVTPLKKKTVAIARKRATTSLVKTTKPVAFAKYTVKRGDTLWGITRNRYGSKVAWQRTYRDNRRVVGGNPHRIYPGTVLSLRR